jgi:hypothetical protein
MENVRHGPDGGKSPPNTVVYAASSALNVSTAEFAQK